MILKKMIRSLCMATVVGSMMFLSGPVSAADKEGPHVDRVSDLLGKTPAAAAEAVVAGYAKPGDGGGGLFTWDAVSTEKSNGITIVGNEKMAGRWKRKTQGALSILACGAERIVTMDNADAINRCLSVASEILIPEGDFYVSDAGITVPSSRTIMFAPKARVLQLPSAKPNYAILKIMNVHDVKVQNPTIVGDKYTHLGTKGEWGMGISIRGSRNVSILSPVISKCWGDAIYIGHGTGPSDNILVSSAQIFDNRRQGMSITSGKNLHIVDTVITETRSDNPHVIPLPHGPHAGIDIEPNDASNEIGLRIENLQTTRNQGYGLSVSLAGLSKALRGEKRVSIQVTGHTDDGSVSGLMLGAVQPDQGTITGEISFSGQKYTNNMRAGITVIDYPASMPLATMKSPFVRDWATAGLRSTKFSSAVSLYNYSGKSDMGNITITAPVFEKTTAKSPWNDSVLYARQSVNGMTIKNFTMIKPTLIGVSAKGSFWGSGKIEGIELRQE